MSGLVFLAMSLALILIGWWASRHTSALVEPALAGDQRRRKEAAVRRGARACSGLGAVFLLFAAMHLIPV